ncbi:hypothetical protein [uncultured Citricoccus sp.]|uniref:hypothetical protein n=1 Tax=uncultured Citricoccus sp. TaxID=614031 RepID=UPI00262C5E6D|nr:hypothetical protein [uncultured Citricoccus sp.]
MKRLQDMTIRQRSRMVCSIGAAVMLVIFLSGFIFQDWIFFLLGAIGAGGVALLFFSNERNTRDDPPHANY